MNRLSIEKRTAIVACLVEGSSIRSTARITGADKETVMKLGAELGLACAEYQDRVMQNLSCKRVQCDEIWSYCYAKDRNLPCELKGQEGYGSCWTWIALDAETKLVPHWVIGPRDQDTAHKFISGLANRLTNRIQLSTDGFKVYAQAVDAAFGEDIDFAMIHKIYASLNSPIPAEVKYSPGACCGEKVVHVIGEPAREHISTSYVERQNLTLRMNCRRFTRLTNAFSKKMSNHAAAQALYFMHYNFVKPHKTLHQATPAIVAGVTDHIWSLEEVVQLLD